MGDGYDMGIHPFWLTQFDTVGLTKDLKDYSGKLSRVSKKKFHRMCKITYFPEFFMIFILKINRSALKSKFILSKAS